MCASCLLVHGVRSEMLRSNDTRPARRRSENQRGGVFIPPFLMRYQSLATNAGTRTQKPSFSVLAVMLLGCPKS
jgi:hypothetical protein